jgi:hypothetical protein
MTSQTSTSFVKFSAVAKETETETVFNIAVLTGAPDDDFHSWIKNFELIASTLNWSARDKNLKLIACTAGKARECFPTLTSSFPRMKIALQGVYYPYTSFKSYYSQWTNLKRNGPNLTAYIAKFEKLLTNANACLESAGMEMISEREKLTTFIASLPIPAQQTINFHMPTTFAQAMDYATRHEAATPFQQRQAPSRFNNQHPNNRNSNKNNFQRIYRHPSNSNNHENYQKTILKLLPNPKPVPSMVPIRMPTAFAVLK